MEEELRLGTYLHYSGLIVLVIGIARHSETEEKFVVYIPLGVKTGPRMTIRPLKMFLAEVETEGKKKRFSYLGTEIPEELAKDYDPLSKK